MTDRRIPKRHQHKRQRDQFRCLVCQQFVTSAESGACPRCGAEPPVAPEAASAPSREAWAEVVGGAQKLAIGPAYWLGAAALCIGIGVVAALLAVKLF